MPAELTLLFGVHAHQPAGNFVEVVDDAHVRSYGPFLRTLHRYPAFRFTAHFSGWLLATLLERFPDDMTLLREMVARGQAELVGGGDMEPVLASIPARDRVSQVHALTDRLERAFAVRPRGAWLTERVWESSVVSSLVEADIDFVTVDDYHFLCAGRELAELDGYFSTEDGGDRLDLFPISEALRYRIPFAPADETVAWLEAQARDPAHHAASIYFDDIEKFGIWPDTYAWVYEQRWLERFVEAVLASPVLRTGHFGEYRDRAPTRGVAYLPTTSYIEMGEWSLPAARADTFADLIAHERVAGRWERHKPFLRGAIWRNFLSRYPEANWMHKRMTALSARLDAIPAARRPAGAQDLLHRTQANDAYWHGLFGGLYLPHLRRAVWNAIAALERTLDAVAPRPEVVTVDLDLDGHRETFLHTPSLQGVIRHDADAALIELISYPLAHNFGDTLTRQREHYHRKLDQAAQEHAQHDGIASAHDRVAFKQPITPADAAPDTRTRSLLRDAYAGGPGAAAVPPRWRTVEPTAFEADVLGGRLTKRYEVEGDLLRARWRLDGAGAAGMLTLTLDVAMPSCDGFLGRVVKGGGAILGGFGTTTVIDVADAVTLEDGVLGGSLSVFTNVGARWRLAPVHSVSQSEAGFEKIMQSLCIEIDLPIATSRAECVLTLMPARATP